MGNKFGIIHNENKENEKKILNIYLFGKSEDFKFEIMENNSFKDIELYKWITNFSNKEITLENLNHIKDDIINKFQTESLCNCILIFLEKNEDPNETINLINNFLCNLSKIYKPIIILAIYESEKKNVESNINIQKDEYIEIVSYNKNNYFNIEIKLKLIYNYYNNISDSVVNLIPMINYFSDNNERVENKEFKSKYKSTFNILIMGKSGCGKSTLINLILNEKKARVGIGLPITKLYCQYIHNSYPITLTDTPGFEENNDFKKLENFLKDYNNYFNAGKNKFHLVLYLINTSNERTFMKPEFKIIDYIYNIMKLPIFFICTRSRTEEASLNFKEEVKISLMQRFGISSNITEHIYCCHLLNEIDGNYKRFGIDKILLGVKNYFSEEITLIKEIESDFVNNEENIIYYEPKKENNLNILNTLEKSINFTNYLNTLLNNIIIKYKNIVYNIDKNNNSDKKSHEDNKIILVKLIETLKNHLALELNCDASEIDENDWTCSPEIEYVPTKYCDSVKTSDNFQIDGEDIKIKDESNKTYFRKIETIENFINKNTNELIKNVNSYMKEIIKDYENAINSFDEIIKFIN